MFGTTDITKIERLLEQIVVNQERMLLCWEDATGDEPEVAEPKRTIEVASDRRDKIFYTTQPVRFVERKIDLATRDGVHCVYLPALYNAVNESAQRRKGSKRPKCSKGHLAELVTTLVNKNRITPVKSLGSGDIGFRITSDKPLPNHLVFLPSEEFTVALNLFVRWN